MPGYVWTAKDKFGQAVTRQIEAPTPEAAKASLVEEGYTELALVGDDIMAEVSKGMSKSFTVLGETVTIPETDKFKHFNKPPMTMRRALWDAIMQGKAIIFIALAIAAYQLYRGSTLGVTLALVGIVAWITFVVAVALPLIYYNRLHKADDWHRNEEALTLVNQLQTLRKFHFIKVPLFELARLRAKALARMGRLEEALKEFAPYEDTPGCPRWLHKAFLAGIYGTAGHHDIGLRYTLESIQEHYQRASYIDIAHYYLRRKNDAASARSALQEVEQGEIADMLKPFLVRTRGLLAFVEGDFDRAIVQLDEFVKKMEASPHLPYRDGSMNVAKAYLCLAVASQGDISRAKKLFDEAEPYLKATGESELITLCQKALATAHQ